MLYAKCVLEHIGLKTNCSLWIAEQSEHTILQELGGAGQTKRPSSCMLIPREPIKNNLAGKELEEFQSLYDDVFKRMKAVQPIF